MEFDQRKLCQNEDFYRTIIETAHDLIWILDTRGNLTFFNRRCEEASGYGLSEWIGGNFSQFIHPEDLPKIQEVFLKTLQGNPQNYEVRAYDRDRKMFILSVNTAPIYEKNKIIGTVSFGRDITESKRMEESLRESEARYRSLVESARDVIFTLSSDGIITSLNPAFETATGWSCAQWIGRDFQPIVHPQDLPLVMEMYQRVLNGEMPPSRFELRILSKSMDYIAAEFTVTPQFHNGGTVSILGIARDITERKRSEEIRLENERLLLASKAKSEFFDTISHEIRTPLTSILGFSELLRDINIAGELNEKQQHFVDKTIANSNHLLRIIDDLLDLSKIEAEKLELAVERFSAHETIDEVVNLINEIATKRSIMIIKEYEMFDMEADKRRFKQILLNLLNNAVKFSKPGGGIVTITAKKSGDTALISISDTGIGIKKDDIGRLFWTFEQLDSGISRKYGGTGLGLAISKKLAELHGGTIEVESSFGKGSTFTLLLPLKANKIEN